MRKQICIFGAGGFAMEVSQWIGQLGYVFAGYIDINENLSLNIRDESFFDPKKHLAVVAIGKPQLRQKIVQKIIDKHGSDVFITLIHPSAIIDNVDVGTGVVICAGCILTCNIKIGDFSQLNLATTIGHDTILGNFFTTAPGAHINGYVKTGNNVYFGSNSSTIERLDICDNVVIGAGACVVKSITKPGTYIGVPAKLINKMT